MFDLKREIRKLKMDARSAFHKSERETSFKISELEKLAFQVKRDRSGLFVDDPETVKILKSAEGQPVKVSVYTFNVMHGDIECNLALEEKDGNYYVKLEKDVAFPLAGKCCVYSVIDAKTKDILFLNTQHTRPVDVQVAAIYGKEKGLSYIHNEIEEVKEQQIADKKLCNDRTNMLDKAEDIITNSTSLVYPQMQSRWAKHVLKSIDGLYVGKDVLDTIKVLTSLKDGQSDKKAFDAIKEGQTSGSLSAVCDAVLEFGKGTSGAAFYKKHTPSYAFATKEKTEQINKEIERVLARNEEYDAVCEIVDAENVGLAD